MEIFEIAPAEGFAGAWVMNPRGQGMASLERGVLQTSWVPAVAYWKTTDRTGRYPIPDVSLSQSVLLVRPELMDGLPMIPGVDYEELEVVRTAFSHRVLSLLKAPGAFDAERSESIRARELIIAVSSYVFVEARLAGRSAFVTDELVADTFVTRPTVDHFLRHKARGLSFKQVWP